MKKIITVFCLILMLTGVFVSCAPKNGEQQPTEGTQTAAKPVNISIVQYKVEAVDALNNAIEAYKNVAPNVSITLETIGGGDDIGPILKARLQSGTLPTIYNIGGPSDIELYEEHLEDLSGEDWVNSISNGLLVNATKGDKLYGLPYAIEGFGLIYNKAIFEDAGVDISTLNSFNGIEAAFAKVKEGIDSGALNEKYPNLEAVTEVPGAEAWVLGDHASNVALAPEFEYDAAVAYKSTRPEWSYSEAYKNIIDLQLDYSKYAQNRSGALAVTYSDEVQSGLALERVACIQQGNWIYNDVKNIDETVAEKLDIMPLPVSGTKEDSIFTLVPMYWCVSSDAADNEKQAAKDFLKWLYQSEEGKKMIVQNFRFIPPFSNYGELYPSDPLATAIKKYSEDGRTMNAVFKGYPDGWATNVIGAKIQGYIEGSLTWEQALAQAADDWEKSRPGSTDEQAQAAEEPQITESQTPIESESAPASPIASNTSEPTAVTD